MMNFIEYLLEIAQKIKKHQFFKKNEIIVYFQKK